MSAVKEIDVKASNAPKLVAKNYESDQDIRWCPGCGDYSILKQTQTVLAEIGLKQEELVFISGIGCSSRFPYYMNTYGMHSIHGRGPAFASGLKAVNSKLSTWLITGDGDSLSIGGNHLIHMLRRNFDLNVLMFNNEIYGLTKGQYSPTSETGKVTKSSPLGSLDHPFNPLAVCLGAESTFIARSMDRDPIHLREILKRANEHKGTSFVEIYQNCNIFNDGAFFGFSEKAVKKLNTIQIKHGEPMIFGHDNEKGLILEGTTPKVVNLSDVEEHQLWVHDETDRSKAIILTRMFENPEASELPRPFGIFYVEQREVYNELMEDQVNAQKEKKGEGDLDALLKGNHTWTIS